MPATNEHMMAHEAVMAVRMPGRVVMLFTWKILVWLIFNFIFIFSPIQSHVQYSVPIISDLAACLGKILPQSNISPWAWPSPSIHPIDQRTRSPSQACLCRHTLLSVRRA